MRRLRQAFRYFLFRRNRLDDEAAREMAFHLEMEAAALERRGETAADARRLALAEFGSVGAVRDAVHDARGLTFWEHLVQDVRFGVRLLRRQPGFTIVAVIILSLGIGANTAVFTLINTMLLKPRPWHAVGEIVGLFDKDTSQPNAFRAFSYPDYVELRARNDVFASLTAHSVALVGVNDGDRMRRVLADLVTSNYFETFGSPLTLGRAFTAAEERPGAEIPVAILSYGAWQRMGSRTDIAGETIRINHRAFQIVGVAAKDFGGSLAFVAPELWLPTGVYDTVVNDIFRGDTSTHLADRSHFNLVVIARLQPGKRAADLGPALASISRGLASANPTAHEHHELLLAPLARMSVSTKPLDDSDVHGVTIALLSVAVIVLFVASFNLANMLLARSAARRNEFAIRLAIGGSRGRVVRQLLTEGLILAVIGGAGGLLIANGATRLLVNSFASLAPITFSFEPTPDWRILTAMVAYCTLSTLVFALLPARRLANTNPGATLKGQAGEIAIPGRLRVGLPNAFVMGQLALSFVLISVAALFLRGSMEAAKANPGFTFDRGVMAQIDPSLAGLNPARSREVYHTALDRLRARPDVVVASVASLMPFGEFEDGQLIQRAGAPLRAGDPGTEEQLVDSIFTSIGTAYFDVLGLSMMEGREFTAAEERRDGPPREAIIDVSLARKLFGTEPAVGQLVQYSPRGENQSPIVLTVVGVAPGIRQNLFDLEPGPHIYVPFGSAFQTGSYLHVRTRATSRDGDAALLPAFRQLLLGVEPNLPILALETRPMYRDRNMMLAVVRMGAAMFIIFGAIALLLAAVGIYGVKAYVVSRRTREIGIRVALGATERGVVWMVVRDGLIANVFGLGAGLLLSSLAGVAMRSLTYQGRAADAAVLGVALVVLAGSALIASWLPARRATSISPITAMRQ
jgi:predicted permease